MSLYEGMFLLDNEVVRADWQKAKSVVADTLTKHGADVLTARRWNERKLAYPIKGRKRGTYLLAYYDISADGIEGLRRDLELSEAVTRYLLLRTDKVPECEIEKGKLELEEGFVPPPPPEDDEPDPPAATPAEAKAEKPAEKPAEKAAEKPAEKPAEKAAEKAPEGDSPAEAATTEAATTEAATAEATPAEAATTEAATEKKEEA